VLLKTARENGVGVVVMKVLAGGELRHGASRLGFVADESKGRDVVGGAVRYAAMNPLISTAVVGMSGTLELVRNLEAVAGVDDSLLEQFNEWSNTVAQMNRGECTRCGLCLDTCPEEIEIPKVMRLFDQQRFFGMDLVARHKYELMPVKASACSRCGKCQEVCPEQFDIAALLGSAHAVLSRAE
jgi:predicted aldo/keto reductase-like oxidoreductase